MMLSSSILLYTSFLTISSHFSKCRFATSDGFSQIASQMLWAIFQKQVSLVEYGKMHIFRPRCKKQHTLLICNGLVIQFKLIHLSKTMFWAVIPTYLLSWCGFLAYPKHVDNISGATVTKKGHLLQKIQHFVVRIHLVQK